MTAKTHPEAVGMWLGLAGVAIFGATLPVTHVALEAFSPFFITFCRALLAAIAAATGLFLYKKQWPSGKIGTLLTAGLCVVYGFPICSSIAMQTIPAAHGGVVLGLLPLLTSLFAALMDGERPGAAFWLYGLAGAGVVILFSLRDGGFQVQAGDLWLFGAAVFASSGYVLLAKVSRSMPGWEAIAWVLVLCSPVSLTGTVLFWKSGILVPGPAGYAALTYLGLMSMFGGFIFWNAGLALGGIGRVAQVQLAQTFITIGISSILLGERITMATVGFGGLVAAIVWLGRNARVARR